jgi:uncharacterized phiE125 gp8 family phage protein
MTVNLKCDTEPTVEPISIDEAKLHLRLDTSPVSDHPDDPLITALIKASRRWCEKFQNRHYITQTWSLYLDRFPKEDYIKIPSPPLQSIVALEYKDSSGALQTVSFLDPSGTALMETDDFIVDETVEPGRLCLKNGKAWPTALLEAKAIRIQFVSGYGAAEDVPDETKTAIYLKLSDLYENRGDTEPGSRFETAAQSLLWLDKIISV